MHCPKPTFHVDHTLGPFSLPDAQGREWAFFRPNDPEAILDKLTNEEFERDGILPYWAENWPSCTVFFHWLSSITFPLHSTICELGCGLGMVAALLGAKGHFVVPTDIVFDGCRLSARNILHYSPVQHVVCNDWCFPPFKSQFDVIVGSDILYERKLIETVLQFISGALKPSGKVYLADPNRHLFDEFKVRAREQGFSLTLEHSAKTDNGKITVDVISLMRC